MNQKIKSLSENLIFQCQFSSHKQDLPQRIGRLIEAGADANYQHGHDGHFALLTLFLGISKKPKNLIFEAAELLLNAGANPNLQTHSGKTLFMNPTHMSEEVLDFLLSHGTNPYLPSGQLFSNCAFLECIFHRQIEHYEKMLSTRPPTLNDIEFILGEIDNSQRPQKVLLNMKTRLEVLQSVLEEHSLLSQTAPIQTSTENAQKSYKI